MPLTDTNKHIKSYSVLRCEKKELHPQTQDFIGEEPLLIRIDEKPYVVVMRTPGQEMSHAAGFCLGEGIVDTPDDFNMIGYCKDLDPNVIDIRLKPERREKIKTLLERKGFVSQTSCGICGKEMVKDIYQIVTPARDNVKVKIDQLLDCINQLSKNQTYYKSTRGSHAAMIMDHQQRMISFAEDVGRHNALDKAVGNIFVDGKLTDAVSVILTSRISYELVQKTARAHIPIMVGMSRPTALAAEMGRDLNMTIAYKDKSSELIIVNGEMRITV